jgi:hypothetical protein
MRCHFRCFVCRCMAPSSAHDWEGTRNTLPIHLLRKHGPNLRVFPSRFSPALSLHKNTTSPRSSENPPAMASSVAATTADGQSGTSQTTPNTENQAKKSRWDGDEDKKISEIVKLQYVYQCLTRFGTFNPLPSGLGT